MSNEIRNKTILIDNYDSFTWNVYQYLCSLGADVIVFRNDKVTMDELVAVNPRNLVISPGPGSPSTSSGISIEAIKYFSGKIPILGVCLGLQCVYELFGGVVNEVGTIVHGKTSQLIHDGSGLYLGVPQRVPVTRYHSLAGSFPTLPKELNITSYTATGVIQGIRHVNYCIEGVQFHPESVLSQHGKTMFSNFLKWQYGTWAENQIEIPQLSLPIPEEKKGEVVDTKDSILVKIASKRREEVLVAMSLPGQSLTDLKKLVALTCTMPVNLYDKLNQNPNETAVLAEIKRASPSKGDINLEVVAGCQALVYANAGASVISVLTEPNWFKGSLLDMRHAKDVVNRFLDRPAILRKDFIIDKYQIYESKLYGADTILLIVAILSRNELVELLQVARQLGMEPLVEVNNESEMLVAVEVGARVIGVNNRNLHSFHVDIDTTSRLADLVPEGTILVALSGINGRADVERYDPTKVKGVLVSEALMRSANPRLFINELKGAVDTVVSNHIEEPVKKTKVKICGLKKVEDAMATAKAGADFLGLVFAENSSRKVSLDQAKAIADAIKQLDFGPLQQAPATPSNLDWFQWHKNQIQSQPRPKLVGVFQNQPAEYCNYVANYVGLDLIQLHGAEPEAYPKFLNFPTIRAFHVGTKLDRPLAIATPNLHAFALLDTATKDGKSSGGSGKTFDWDIAQKLVHDFDGFQALLNLEPNQTTLRRSNPGIFLAGGLNPTNVVQAIQKVNPYAVDVSSGVENPQTKEKDLQLILEFLKQVQSTFE